MLPSRVYRRVASLKSTDVSKEYVTPIFGVEVYRETSEMFLGNMSWISTYYTASYPRRTLHNHRYENLKSYICSNVWIYLAQDRDRWLAHVKTEWTSDFHKIKAVVEYLSPYQLMKGNAAPSSSILTGIWWTLVRPLCDTQDGSIQRCYEIM
jgi:hypothetical protein